MELPINHIQTRNEDEDWKSWERRWQSRMQPLLRRNHCFLSHLSLFYESWRVRERSVQISRLLKILVLFKTNNNTPLFLSQFQSVSWVVSCLCHLCLCVQIVQGWMKQWILIGERIKSVTLLNTLENKSFYHTISMCWAFAKEYFVMLGYKELFILRKPWRYKKR